MKRKLANTSITEEAVIKKTEDPISFVIREAIDLVIKTADNLEQKLTENPNTKREIKELIFRLKRGTETLKRKTSREWLEEHKWKRVEVPKYEVETQTATQRKETADSSTQTDPWNKSPIRITSLEGEYTLARWQAEESKAWDKDLYTNTEMEVGNPVTSEAMVKVVIVEPEDPAMEKSIQRIYRDRFPDLQNATGDLEVLEELSRLRSKATEETTRKIIRIISNGTDEDIWEKLNKLKEEVTNDKTVAMHHIKSMSPQRFRKMVEFIFHNTQQRLVIYTPRQVDTTEPKIRKQTQPKQRQTYALVVEDRDKDYTEILRVIKPTINANAAKNAIRGLRSTRDGKLLITTDQNIEAIEELQKEIGKISPDIKTRALGQTINTETVHIRGIDALTQQEEIAAAIEEKIGAVQGKRAKLSELRPNANNTQAMTVTLEKEDAENLIREGQIRIGVVNCTIEKRLSIPKCRRCWSYEHKISDCSGPDRKKKCYKCGSEGHIVKECTETINTCPICNMTGHKMGTGKCPAFRRALAAARKGARYSNAMQELKAKATESADQNLETMDSTTQATSG